MESSRCWSTRSQAEEYATLTPITAAIKLHGNNLELANVCVGSKAEKLKTSKCFPICPRKADLPTSARL
jgi:hypothetical protein